MKIYQIHEYGGMFEDSFDKIIYTFFSKEKAEDKLSELNIELKRKNKRIENCDKCFQDNKCKEMSCYIEDSFYCFNMENSDLFAVDKYDIKEVELDDECPCREPVYIITCFEKLEKDKNGWPDFGGMAFMGLYREKEIAFENVKINNCDIAERCYKYAVIEEVTPGLYQYPRPRWFFKYNFKEDIFEKIEEPNFMKHIANVL